MSFLHEKVRYIFTFSWSVVLYTTLDGVRRRKSPEEVYTDVQFAVNVAQTAAVLEIVHAATRIVRTPVFTTLMQVWSRVMVLWMVTYLVPSVSFKSKDCLLLT